MQKTSPRWIWGARPGWYVFVILLLAFSMSAYSATRFSNFAAGNSAAFQAHGGRAPAEVRGLEWSALIVLAQILPAQTLLDSVPFVPQPLSRSLDNRPPPSC